MDRNARLRRSASIWLESLSARRAWIEMSTVIVILRKTNVALRKESVDRNPYNQVNKGGRKPSLSARRAWIEMETTGGAGLPLTSLSARRAWIEMHSWR